MRAVVATTSYPRHPDNPAGRFVAASVAGLDQAGVQVEVLAPDHLGATDHQAGLHWLRHAPRRRWQTLCYGDGILPNLAAAPWRAGLIPGLLAAQIAALRRRRQLPTVAHWLLPSGLAAVLAGVRRVLGVVHGSDLALLEQLPGGAQLARWLAARMARLLFVSTDLQQRFAQLVGREHGELLPPTLLPVEPAAREIARRELEIDASAPVVLFLGRLLASKNATLLIETMRSLPAPAQLLVAGAGPERLALQRQALGLGDRVRFLGRVPPSRHALLFGAADLLVLCSRPAAGGHAEGAPVVLLEAMAAGLPVVATAVGGVPELLDGGAGALVPAGDAAVLAATLSSLLADPPARARLALRGRQAVQPWLPGPHGQRLRALLEQGPTERLP